MPLATDAASQIASELQHAAEAARQKAKSDEDMAKRAYCASLALLGRGDKKVKVLDHLNRYRSLQVARHNINACESVLEGLVLIASNQYTRGLPLFELGVRSAAIPYDKLPQPNDDMTLGEAWIARQALLNEDLPALREHCKVKPGIVERVIDAKVKHTSAADYMAEMLGIYARVELIVAAALECSAIGIHKDRSSHTLGTAEPTVNIRVAAAI